jgi:hypothetical protein
VASTASTLAPPSDVFVVTHYPRYIRPFNFHPSDDDSDNTTNSFDIIIRGQECCSAAQFIHTEHGIREAMSANKPPVGADSPGWRAYTEAHEAGMPPWGGYASKWHNSFVKPLPHSQILGADDSPVQLVLIDLSKEFWVYRTYERLYCFHEMQTDWSLRRTERKIKVL